MMTGTVLGTLEPVIQLIVRDSMGADHRVNFLIDTGFSGYVALPAQWISRLGLTVQGDGQLTLADNQNIVTSMYETTLVWNNTIRTIDVFELPGDPMIGTSLLFDFRLTINFVNGGNVTLQRLPPT